MDQTLTLKRIAAYLQTQGWKFNPPASMPLEEGERVNPSAQEVEEAIVALLREKGYGVIKRPDYALRWEPAFKPWFYEAGGDKEGQLYCRVDLPEAMFYALQDAAREGVKHKQDRLAGLKKIEREVAELERTSAEPRTVGVLDGVALTSMELRGVISFLTDDVRRHEEALDRADTRRHKA